MLNAPVPSLDMHAALRQNFAGDPCQDSGRAMRLWVGAEGFFQNELDMPTLAYVFQWLRFKDPAIRNHVRFLNAELPSAHLRPR